MINGIIRSSENFSVEPLQLLGWRIVRNSDTYFELEMTFNTDVQQVLNRYNTPGNQGVMVYLKSINETVKLTVLKTETINKPVNAGNDYIRVVKGNTLRVAYDAAQSGKIITLPNTFNVEVSINKGMPNALVFTTHDGAVFSRHDKSGVTGKKSIRATAPLDTASYEALDFTAPGTDMQIHMDAYNFTSSDTISLYAKNGGEKALLTSTSVKDINNTAQATMTDSAQYGTVYKSSAKFAFAGASASTLPIIEEYTILNESVRGVLTHTASGKKITLPPFKKLKCRLSKSMGQTVLESSNEVTDTYNIFIPLFKNGEITMSGDFREESKQDILFRIPSTTFTVINNVANVTLTYPKTNIQTAVKVVGDIKITSADGVEMTQRVMYNTAVVEPKTPPVVIEPTVFPDVIPIETSSYLTGTNQMNVNWKLVFSDPFEGDTVNVRHTDTSDGVVREYAWGVTPGSLTWAGDYVYKLDAYPSVTHLTYEVLPGEKYNVGLPSKATINIADKKPVMHPDVSISESSTYEANTNQMNVTWTLLFTEAYAGGYVNVKHTDPVSGAYRQYTWSVPAGSLEWSSDIIYRMDTYPELKELTCEILPGDNYNVDSPSKSTIIYQHRVPVEEPEAVTVVPSYLIEDTTLQNIWFMPAPGYLSTEHEYSINSGGAWQDTTGNVVDLYGKTVATGAFQLRVKAKPGKSAGPIVMNTKKFAPVSIVWSEPITISKGGVYSGNWRSSKADQIVINITTSEPVVIENSNFETLGIAINAQYGTYNAQLGHGMGINLTVRNCRFKGLPIPDGVTLTDSYRMAIRVGEPINVVIENNYVQDMQGFQVRGKYRGNGTVSNTVRIRYNRGVNISTMATKEGAKRALGNWVNWGNSYADVPHVEIAWNHNHQHMGKSDVEDTYSLSSVRGTATAPAKIHHNCVRGASYYKYQTHGDPSYSSGYYSGVCFMVESVGSPAKVQDACNHLHITDNYAFDSNNGHYSVCSATNVKVLRNTAVSKAMADKEDVRETDVDGGEFKGYSGSFFHNDAYYNLGTAEGVQFDSNRRAVAADYRISEKKNTALASGRNDAHYEGSTAVKVYETNPVLLELGVEITEHTVNKYENEWWDLVKTNNLIIGPSEKVLPTQPPVEQPPVEQPPVEQPPVVTAITYPADFASNLFESYTQSSKYTSGYGGSHDVVLHYGAKGDGVTDDTAAIQAALDANRAGVDQGTRGDFFSPRPKTIFFPEGTYLVSKEFAWIGQTQMLMGAGRDKTIIKLIDSAPGFNDPANPKRVIKTPSGIQQFRNYLRDMTIDTGSNNKGAIGVDFIANNSGGIINVTIKSGDLQGVMGLDLTRYAPGPMILHGVTIIGFDHAMRVKKQEYSITIEDLNISKQRVGGIENNGNVLSMRRFTSDNTVSAVINTVFTSMVTMLESQMVGGSSANSAIDNQSGNFLLRDVTVAGYKAAVNNGGTLITDTYISEVVSKPTMTLFQTDTKTMNLPIHDIPEYHSNDVNDWIKIASPGWYGDNRGWQAAMDSGKPILYMQTGTYYAHNRTYTVPLTLRKMMGFGAYIAKGSTHGMMLIVEEGDENSPPLFIEHFGDGIWIEHKCKRPIVVKHSKLHNYVAYEGSGDLHLCNVELHKPVTFYPGQNVWARQWNNELRADRIVNNGANLWIMGLKTERKGFIVNTINGGRTEILGGLVYPVEEFDTTDPPAFSVDDTSDLCVSFSTSSYNEGYMYPILVEETRGGVTKQLSKSALTSRSIPLFTAYRK
jgi:hypothetical protein